jgi:hypothetical protein
LRYAGDLIEKEDKVLNLRDQGDLKDKSWRELCEAASREQDTERLLELITALNDVLERREEEKKRIATAPRRERNSSEVVP